MKNYLVTSKKLGDFFTILQLNEYETVPYFLQSSQKLFVDFCVFTCFYQFLRDVIIILFCRSKQSDKHSDVLIEFGVVSYLLSCTTS